MHGGELVWWAEQIFHEVGGCGYAEFSPSGRGIKLWELIPTTELGEVDRILRIAEGARGTKLWVGPMNSGAKAQQIEFFRARRWFALTSNKLPEASDHLGIMGVQQAERLMEIAADCAEAIGGASPRSSTATASAEVADDPDLPARVEALLADPGKGRANNWREVQRIWAKTESGLDGFDVLPDQEADSGPGGFDVPPDQDADSGPMASTCHPHSRIPRPKSHRTGPNRCAPRRSTAWPVTWFARSTRTPKPIRLPC